MPEHEEAVNAVAKPVSGLSLGPPMAPVEACPALPLP